MYRDILLPIDVNEKSSWDKALPTAVEYCKAFGSTLHIMSVVPDFGFASVAQYFPEGTEEKLLRNMARTLREFIEKNVPEGIPVQDIVAHGNVPKEIIATAKKIDADLIVMASHRPDLKDYLLGPNSAYVTRHTDRSVLVVRG